MSTTLNNEECYKNLKIELEKICKETRVVLVVMKGKIKINNPAQDEIFMNVFEVLPPIVGGITLYPMEDEMIFYAKEFFTYHSIHGLVRLNFEKEAESMVLSMKSNPKNADFYLYRINKLKKLKKIRKLKNIAIRYWSRYGDEIKDFIRIYHTDI